MITGVYISCVMDVITHIECAAEMEVVYMLSGGHSVT